jgi:hypothetical protein
VLRRPAIPYLVACSAVSAGVIEGLAAAAMADPDPGGGGFSFVQCGQAGAPRCHLSAGSRGSRGGARPRPAAAGGGRKPLCPSASALPATVGCAVLTRTTGGGAPAVSPAVVARLASADLGLPRPVIEASPRPADIQITYLPTWLWVDRSVWRPRSKTASVPGVSVTATARPVSVSWSMGDGGGVVCHGPGTPYAGGADPARPSPDCGYTYTRPSAGRPHDAFHVTATITWTIRWSGGGRAGSLPPLTSTAGAAFPVAEAPALAVLAGG